MMNSITKINVLLFISAMVLSGCASNSIKQVDSEIADKVISTHINKLKATHNSALLIQTTSPDNHKIKPEWIQPDNKGESCLVYRDYINHYSKKPIVAWGKENGVADYQLLWDGLCQNGYASGLGREIEQGKGVDRYTLSRYSSEPGIKPIRYIQEDYLNGNRREGDLNNHIYVDVNHHKKFHFKSLKKGDKMMEDGNIVTLGNVYQAPYNPFGIEDVLGIDIKPISNGKNQILTYGFIGSDINKTSKIIKISNLDRARLNFISKYNDGSNVSFSKSVFESQNLLSRSATYNNDKGNIHGINYSKNTREPGSIFERVIESISLWNDGKFLGVADRVDNKIKEEYAGFLDLIEKDSSDLANVALVNRIASLDAKNEYMDSICTENSNNNFCKKENYDENLNKYIAMIKNIRAASETFKPSVVALYDKNMHDISERFLQRPNALNFIANLYTTSKILKKIRPSGNKKRYSPSGSKSYNFSGSNAGLGGRSNSSGLNWDPVYVGSGEEQNWGGGNFGFNNKPNVSNLNYYCNTYADDYVCNSTMMNKRYSGSSGSRYKFDLSNPFDRSAYSTDVGAQINDTFSSDRFLDQGLGQFGGGSD